jgi:hypothetical protein
MEKEGGNEMYEGFSIEGMTKVMEYLLGVDYAEKKAESEAQQIPKDHKCWNCVWANYVGTGFFCPLVGCVKGV